MPMTFTDELVTYRLEGLSLDQTGSPQERWERLAVWVEGSWEDFVEAWEIRTGRPWTQMTSLEAAKLYELHPQCQRNPAVLSKLIGG